MSAKNNQSCRTCAHWDIDSVRRTPTGRLVRDASARCLWIWGELKLPDSVSPWHRKTQPVRMYAVDGETCPCYVKREDVK